MLVKLIPDQISTYWDVLKEGIDKSLPPEIYGGDNVLNNILDAALRGELQLWVGFLDGTNTVYGMVATNVQEDSCALVRSLVLYSVYNFNRNTIQDQEQWKKDFSTIRKYAKGVGCERIIGYTKSMSLLAFAIRELKGKASSVVVVLSVEEE